MPHQDELGTLAGAFNQMTQGLLLKERYRSVLDKVVSPDVADELLKGDLRLGGETREVTTLFADVRGFSSLTEHHDAGAGDRHAERMARTRGQPSSPRRAASSTSTWGTR